MKPVDHSTPQPSRAPYSLGTVILIVVAWFAAIVGLTVTNRLTESVAIIAFGCFLAICARILQASRHHRDLLQALSKFDNLREP